MKSKMLKKVLVSTMIIGTLLLSACGGANGTNNGNSDGAGSPAAAEPVAVQEDVVPATEAAEGPIRIVLYPNESGSQFSVVHDYMEALIYEATGRPGEIVTTTNYNIAIEAIAQGSADIAFMGPTGYIIASQQNPNVQAIFTASGESGTLEDAVYFAFLAVREEDVDNWADGPDSFDLSALEGEIISFVSPTSTSGFVVPGTFIINEFGLEHLDNIAAPGFFSQVNFPESHQGSAFSLISGQSNVAAFMNQESLFEHVGGPLNDAGMIYQVREDAAAPLDQVRGERLVIIHAITVPNGPFVANFDNLTQAEVDAIVAIFTSDAVANNPNFFSPADSGIVAWETQVSGNERFVPVDPSMYDDLR